MNLKDFLANRDTPPELYWSLVLEPGWVQAGIWYIGDTSAEVVSTSSPVVWQDNEELVSSCDAALSSSIQNLPEEYKEPTKTVFGVPSSWVKNGEIDDKYLAEVKKLCTELSLTPVGFVVISEAIAHYYKAEEGSPVSAIVIGLGTEELELSVFNLGNLLGSTKVARSVSIAEDVIEGLSRFEGRNPLPSRIIVYDGKEGELEEAKEELLKANWENVNEKIRFLHTPKVEVLPSENKVLATSLAGANEIGNVAKVSKNKVLEKEEVSNIESPRENVTPEDLGFAVNQDVASPPKDLVTAPTPKLKVSDYLQKTKNIFRDLQMPKISGGKKTYLTVLIFITAAIAVFGVYWWFVPQAQVTIYVSPKKFSQETEFGFDRNNSQILTSEVSGEKTKSTTGTKTIGDKAKGSVQIQNGTAFPINLDAGTVLSSSGNLKFDMDQSASVSAALSPSSPGTVTISLTADSIGAEYNLAKDELFRIGNYPKAEVDATALSDFMGGSSRQISAVDAKDQEDILASLRDELSQKAATDFSVSVNENQVFVNELAGFDIISSNFDHKVGEEADSLKLSLRAKAIGVAADKEKLLTQARSDLQDKIPQGYVLRDSQIKFKFSLESSSSGTYRYKTDLTANFLPQVNTDDIIDKIAGRSPASAHDYLTSVPGFTRAEVKLKPNLPGFLGTLPRVHKNIVVVVTAEQ